MLLLRTNHMNIPTRRCFSSANTPSLAPSTVTRRCLRKVSKIASQHSVLVKDSENSDNVSNVVSDSTATVTTDFSDPLKFGAFGSGV